MANTGNPMPSGDPLDFYVNTQNLDLAMNSKEANWIDRFGIARFTWEGITKGFNSGALEQRNGKTELRDWISIREFGVVFDNVTDNYEALQRAFSSGKRIEFYDPGEGNFAMTSKPLKWSSRTTIRGPGMHIPVIKAMASMPGELDLIQNEHYMSSSLQYDRNMLGFDLCVHANGFARTKTLVGEWGRGIRMAAVFDTLLVRCKVIEGPQHCIDITNYNDTYLGVGHNGKVIGPSFNVVIADSEIQDYCYDDGITTHGSYSILIDNCVGRISDLAKTKHQYVSTQNAFEIDDGSWDVVVVNSRAYCNNTKSKGFSVATHSNRPAAYNIAFDNCTAYNAIIGFNAWADISTDAVYGTDNWKCRNITIRNFTLREPFVDKTVQNYPSRCMDLSGFMNIDVDGLAVYMADDSGVVQTPISMLNINGSQHVRIKRFSVKGAQDDSLGSVVYRDSAWINILGPSKDISIDGVDIDNIGYCNRIISDSQSNALVSVKNLLVRRAPNDGQTKLGIVSGAQNVVYENIVLPSSIVPYKVGRGFSQYPAGDYQFNQLGPIKNIVGGMKIISETSADGTQMKPGILFDNQFTSPDQVKGKGNIAFRTSDTKEAGFFITAYHDDADKYVPIISVYDRATWRSLEPGLDDTTTLGRNVARFKTGYFASNIITTSDAREKSLPKVIPDAVLDAGDKISVILFQWLSAIEEKGVTNARWHFGPIAQQIRDAFLSVGLNGTDYGLLCYDKWPEKKDLVYEEQTQEDGSVVIVETGEERVVQEAGDRWGIRPDQCLWLVTACATRRAERMETRMINLERRLSAAKL